MSTVAAVDSVNVSSLEPAKSGNVKKALLIAVSVLMALGMILSYSLGAPWIVIVGFFFLALSPLFPLGQNVDDQRARILG